jgi:hypothetical protein
MDHGPDCIAGGGAVDLFEQEPASKSRNTRLEMKNADMLKNHIRTTTFKERQFAVVPRRRLEAGVARGSSSIKAATPPLNIL